MGVTIDDARAIAAFYHDDTIMGFGFPREEREALVASEPDKFLVPRPSHMRYQWICVQLAIDVDELRELLIDTWRMCLPKKVAAACVRVSKHGRRRALRNS